MKASGEEWQIRFYEEGGEPTLGLCATGDHAHKDWQQYKECYAKAKEKIGLRQRLREIRGTKLHELCRLCVDIFTDHEEAQCPWGPELRNPPLLDLWDHLTVAFIQFMGVMAGHTRGTLEGSCPLC